MTMPQQDNVTENTLYVDESGDDAFSLLDQLPHRYLALFGVWFRKDDYLDFEADLNRLKMDVFGRQDVVLHREDTINQRGALSVLSEPTVRARFDDGLFGVIDRAGFNKWLVVIDKQRVSVSIRTDYNPYHAAFYSLLHSYSEWLLSYRESGSVVAETRGKTADKSLQDKYCDDYQKFSNRYVSDYKRMPITSEQIQLEPKDANVAGLQVADLLAHPYKQYCLIHERLIPDKGPNFGTRLSALLMEKAKNERQPWWTIIV